MTQQELYTYNFYLWELRGRGWLSYDVPTVLEPPFEPFSHDTAIPVREEPDVDDGEVKFLPLRVFDGLKKVFTTETKLEQTDDEDQPNQFLSIPLQVSQQLVELELQLPMNVEISLEYMHEFLLMLTACKYQLCFEIIGTSNDIIIQIVCDKSDKSYVLGNIQIFLPEVIISKNVDLLDKVQLGHKLTTIVHYGLTDEFMKPLNMEARHSIDPLTGIYATLEQIRDGECGIIQIMFQGTTEAWSSSLLHAMSDNDGGCFFADDPEMLSLTKEKVSSPLFAVSIRAVVESDNESRNNELLEGLFRGLTAYTNQRSNVLSPIENQVPFHDLYGDIYSRTSHYSGMILNSRELVNLMHLPIGNIASTKLQKFKRKTHALPMEHVGQNYMLGVNTHHGISQAISLNHQERLRHLHVIGATGSGKSNLIKNLIIEDMQNGQGICVLDPHGDLIEDVIGHIPEHRIKEVILVDPSDTAFPIGLNLLQAETDIEKIVLESDLVSVFRRQSTSWGDQMTSILSNAINAFVESSRGGSLLDLRRFLVDKVFRNEFLTTVQDDQTLQFWHKEFHLLKSNSIASILTRLDTFLRPKTIRYMMEQKKGLNFDEIINSEKILLVKLSQGLIGEQNSHLLGTLFITKLNQASQQRQSIEASERTPYYLYIDEFQNFITESMASILSGARKYGLGLVLAHQDMEQVMVKDREVANSVLSNPYTRICFRCGEQDARKVESGFANFDADDIQNLKVGEAIARIGQNTHDGNIDVALFDDIEHDWMKSIRSQVIENTRRLYPVEAVEKSISKPQPIPIEEVPKQDLETKQVVFDSITTEPNITEEQTDIIVKRYEQKQVEREHLLIQAYIKKIAEERGFKATLEEPTPYGGRVDVGLQLGKMKLACEVSVTNTPEYEVQNIQKCLDSGYARVFMISEDAQHLKTIRVKTIESLSNKDISNVFFIRKEAMIDHLTEIVAQSQKPKQKVHRGYKVNVKMDQDSACDDKRQSLNDIIISSMKRDL